MSYDQTRHKKDSWATGYADVRCDGCGNALEPAFPEDVYEDGSWHFLQPKNGLQMVLSGGYGMYFDSTNPTSPRFMFCEECADKLLELFPNLKVIEQQ